MMGAAIMVEIELAANRCGRYLNRVIHPVKVRL
jgi:hypothetical protein